MARHRGRHAAPVDHHGKDVVTGTLAAMTLSTGGLMVLVPNDAPVPSANSTVTPAGARTDEFPAIRLDAASTPTYTVRSGDTLSGIGVRVNEDWHTLYADNQRVVGADPNLIFPDQVLALNGSAAPAAIPAPAAPVAVVPAAHAAGVTGADVVADAKHYLGVPYLWGGSTPVSGLDCSGLTALVYGMLGVRLPHNAALQSHLGTPIYGLANAQPGDLLFFYTPISHVAIYIGNGQMIAAPQSGEVVQIQSVWATPTAIRRYV